MSKHTPFPWQAVPDGTAGSAYEIRHDFGTVARVYGIGTDEAKSNAAMIVALEDLLAAAKYAVAIIQGPEPMEHIEPWAQDICGRLNAAVRKAEGK